MLWGSLYKTLHRMTPFRLKINAVFLYVVQANCSWKVCMQSVCIGLQRGLQSRKLVTEMALVPGVPLWQWEGSAPAWSPSPSCCVCSLGWQWAGKTKVLCKVIGSACTPAAGHTVKTSADTEKPDSLETAASTAHDFSRPVGNRGINMCQPSWGSAWVWRTATHCRDKRNMLLLMICIMLEDPVPLHDSPAQSGSQQPSCTVAFQEPKRGRVELQLMELHWEKILHVSMHRPGTAWARCSSWDLLWGRAFTQLMAKLSLPKQAKIQPAAPSTCLCSSLCFREERGH